MSRDPPLGRFCCGPNCFCPPHVDKIRDRFVPCDIISTPHNYQITRSFIFRSIWAAWKRVDGLVHWKMLGNRLSLDMAKRQIWSWKQEGTCISNLPRFQERRLSRKHIFLWRDLSDFNARFLEKLVNHGSGIRFVFYKPTLFCGNHWDYSSKGSF